MNPKNIQAMYIISNNQLADCIRFTELMIETMPVNDNRSYNIKRMAGILLKQLRVKQPLSESELSELKRISAKQKRLQCNQSDNQNDR